MFFLVWILSFQRTHVLIKLQNKEEILQTIRGSIELAHNLLHCLWVFNVRSESGMIQYCACLLKKRVFK